MVLQFHYTKWPDYGTPKLAAPLLNFLKAVRASNPENVGPIIVHCRWETIYCGILKYTNTVCTVTICRMLDVLWYTVVYCGIL